jgi:hypothetical protein
VAAGQINRLPRLKIYKELFAWYVCVGACVYTTSILKCYAVMLDNAKHKPVGSSVNNSGSRGT